MKTDICGYCTKGVKSQGGIFYWKMLCTEQDLKPRSFAKRIISVRTALLHKAIYILLTLNEAIE